MIQCYCFEMFCRRFGIVRMRVLKPMVDCVCGSIIIYLMWLQLPTHLNTYSHRFMSPWWAQKCSWIVSRNRFYPVTPQLQFILVQWKKKLSRFVYEKWTLILNVSYHDVHICGWLWSSMLWVKSTSLWYVIHYSVLPMKKDCVIKWELIFLKSEQ